MMLVIFGVVALLFGTLNFVASFVIANRGDQNQSIAREGCAVGWYILAAICLR